MVLETAHGKEESDGDPGLDVEEAKEGGERPEAPLWTEREFHGRRKRRRLGVHELRVAGRSRGCEAAATSDEGRGCGQEGAAVILAGELRSVGRARRDLSFATLQRPTISRPLRHLLIVQLAPSSPPHAARLPLFIAKLYSALCCVHAHPANNARHSCDWTVLICAVACVHGWLLL